ncbi:MAG: hypothetical protein KGM42_04890 [Hyphomicrobiales bacterium]|nr:hypothetical protein [Hyphomicrobiales bacterium]
MLRWFGLVLALVLSAPAAAGAFMQPPEEGQIISQLAFSGSTRAYDGYGRLGPIPAWRKFELTTYAEYGLTDWLTVIGSPSWFTFRAPEARPSNYFGPLPTSTLSRVGAAEVGARIALVEWTDEIISFQATARYAAGGVTSQPYVDMGRRAQIDARLLYGRNFEMLDMSGYFDAQIGFRTGGPLGPQLRFDMTYALRPIDFVTIMLQSFTEITPGALGQHFMLQQKVQASALVDITSNVALQLGVLGSLRGVNAARERGVVTGVWVKF